MKAWLRRLVRVMPLAFALLAGCGLFGGAKSPELAAREQVRGAVHGMAFGAQMAAEVCRDIVKQMDAAGDKRADAVYDGCFKAWDVAFESLMVADSIVDAWDAGAAGKVVCLASRAMEALSRILAVIDASGMKLPADLRATIDDGVALGKFLMRLAPSAASCPLPAKMPVLTQPGPTPGSTSRNWPAATPLLYAAVNL